MNRPRAIQYTVVTSDDFGKFEDRVNDLLSEGWQIQGGVSTAILPDFADRLQHIQWSQALTLSALGEPDSPALALEEPLPEDLQPFAPEEEREEDTPRIPRVL